MDAGVWFSLTAIPLALLAGLHWRGLTPGGRSALPLFERFWACSDDRAARGKHDHAPPGQGALAEARARSARN